jgi:hypothetical protein
MNWLSLHRFGFAALGIVALIEQSIANVADIPDYKPLNFLSFFTVEAVIIAIASLAISGVYGLRGNKPPWVHYVRGAATIYMTVSGITYALLLQNIRVESAVPWVNFVLHYVIPIVLVIDWLIDLPQFRIRARSAMIWMMYPIIYLAYSLIRGPIANWYPYPFLDPRPQGYAPVIGVSFAIMLGTLGVVLLMSWTTRLRVSVERRQERDADAPQSRSAARNADAIHLTYSSIE